MSSFRDVSLSETGRRDCLGEKLVSRYAADVPTATPRENRSSDLGRAEKDMSSQKAVKTKLLRPEDGNFRRSSSSISAIGFFKPMPHLSVDLL